MQFKGLCTIVLLVSMQMYGMEDLTTKTDSLNLIPFVYSQTTQEASLEKTKAEKKETFYKAYTALNQAIEKGELFDYARHLVYFNLLQKEPIQDIELLINSVESPLLTAVNKLSELSIAHNLQADNETYRNGKLTLMYILEDLCLYGLFMSSKWLKRDATPLIAACSLSGAKQEDQEKIVSLLLAFNADPNESITKSDGTIFSPLAAAKKYGYQNIVQLLLAGQEESKNENVESTTRNPIDYVKKKWEKRKRYLRNKNENKLNKDSENLKDPAIEGNLKNSAIEMSVSLNKEVVKVIEEANYDKFENLLMHPLIGPNYEYEQDGKQYRMLSAVLSEYFLYNLLLGKNNVKTQLYEKMLTLLLRYDVDTNIAYGEDSTPLDAAIRNENAPLTHLLISHGARLDFKRDRALTPLQMAQMFHPAFYENELASYLTLVDNE